MKAILVHEGAAFLRYVEIPGDDPPLIWIHGVICSSTGELMPVATQPPLRGRRMLLVDLLGYGYSDKPESFGYSLEAHAATIVTLLDHLDAPTYVLVGHSMGGTVSVLAATSRPDRVTALILAEPGIEPGGVYAPPISSQEEDDFVRRGFSEMLEDMREKANRDPQSPLTAHVGITQAASPRALHRVSRSIMRGTQPSIRTLLGRLRMPRYYLGGEQSEQALPPQPDLIDAGVVWRTVPRTGHAMGLVNPLGFADTVAEILEAEQAPPSS